MSSLTWNWIADAALQLTPQGNGTLVAWSIDTDLRAGVPFLMQLRCVWDRTVGQYYNARLANLKALVEQ